MSDPNQPPPHPLNQPPYGTQWSGAGMPHGQGYPPSGDQPGQVPDAQAWPQQPDQAWPDAAAGPGVPPAGQWQQPQAQWPSQPPTGFPPHTKPDNGGKTVLILVLVGAVVLALAAGGALWAFLAMQEPDDGSTSTTTAEPKATMENHGVVIGEGPDTVDIYLDFLCPACANFDQEYGERLSEGVGHGTLKVVYHPVGMLDGASAGTEYSTRSAAASICAADEGRFVEYADALFADQPAENGPGHDDATLAKIGMQIGFSKGFETCVTTGAYHDWATEATHAAINAGISTIPHVLVNGEALSQTSELGAKLDELAGS